MHVIQTSVLDRSSRVKLRIAQITIFRQILQTKNYKPCVYPLLNLYPFNAVFKMLVIHEK